MNDAPAITDSLNQETPIFSETKACSESESRWQSTTVTVNTESTSVSMFLLCFFLPFIAPIVVLIKGQLGFLVVILVLWMVSAVLMMIPVIWWLLVFVIHLIICFKVAKMKSKTKVVVNNS